MRSINRKITVILIVSFLLQVLLIGSLYRFVIAKSILSDINKYEKSRQTILQSTVLKIEKVIDEPDKIKNVLDVNSEKYDIKFELKDIDGNIAYSNYFNKKENRNIEEMGIARLKKRPYYVIHAFFPIKAQSFARYTRLNGTRLVLILIVFSISLAASFLIYRIFSVPLNKVRKAMNSTSYGNTVISIPYYGDDELGLLCRNFEDMGKRLKKSKEEEIELIQAISHDLKTPMTSIIGYMNRLINGKANSEEKRKEYYEIVYRKANDMKLLLNDLEEYASIGIELKYDMQPVDVSKFIVDICEEIRCEVEERDGSFKCLNSIDVAFEMLVDEVKIRRVFTNIVENSFKYAGENCELSVETFLQGEFILFQICDNGIGVPEEQLGKVFDRFYRAEVSRSRERGGTGLGLTICRSIVEGHGGKIWAKQNAGGGLCISFTIPVRKASK